VEEEPEAVRMVVREGYEGEQVDPGQGGEREEELEPGEAPGDIDPVDVVLLRAELGLAAAQELEELEEGGLQAEEVRRLAVLEAQRACGHCEASVRSVSLRRRKTHQSRHKPNQPRQLFCAHASKQWQSCGYEANGKDATGSQPTVAADRDNKEATCAPPRSPPSLSIVLLAQPPQGRLACHNLRSGRRAAAAGQQHPPRPPLWRSPRLVPPPRLRGSLLF
jgi:hypothetical protein